MSDGQERVAATKPGPCVFPRCVKGEQPSYCGHDCDVREKPYEREYGTPADGLAASRHKAVFMGDAATAVYRLMMEMDKHEDLDEHPIRQSEAYNDAMRGLGWDIDWEAVRNAGP